MYWPKEGMETYGVIQVRLVKEDIMATYTVRTLQIRHLRVSDHTCVKLEIRPDYISILGHKLCWLSN